MKDNDIPSPLPGDSVPGQRTSICEEALRPALQALAERAGAAGWTVGEVAAAIVTLGTDRVVAVAGQEAAGEILMLALDRARMSEPGG